jgi:FKBP-type peptidyl-prolyl cis-trans isomerase
VLPEFEAAVKQMLVGETKSVLIRQPYGLRGSPPFVPGGADLTFEITLVSTSEAAASLMSNE